MTEVIKRFATCDICGEQEPYTDEHAPFGWLAAFNARGVSGHCCADIPCRRVFVAWCENVGAEPPPELMGRSNG